MSNRTTDANHEGHSLNIYLNLFYLIFGNIGNLFKIAFFLQKPLRSCPCIVYVLFATLSDLVTLNNLPMVQLFVYLYPQQHWIEVPVDWSTNRNQSMTILHPVSGSDIFTCKARIYLHMLSTDLSFQMLLFASINRFCLGYRRKQRQQRENHRYALQFTDFVCHLENAYKLCLICSLIWIVISLQHAFNFTIFTRRQGCIPQILIIWQVWIVSVHCFLLPILLTIFGLMTLRNIRHWSLFGKYRQREFCRRHHSHRPFVQMCHFCTSCHRSSQNQIDIQLTSMIITEILVTIVTSLPYGTYIFYHLIASTQAAQRLSETKWILSFVRMTIYFEPSCGFYIYLITLTTLRKRFSKMFSETFMSAYNRCWNK